MKLLLLGSLAVLIALISVNRAFACSCPTIGSEEYEINSRLKTGSAVFSGEVLEIVSKPDYRNVTFRVKEFWKGYLSTKFTVATDPTTSSCSIDFEKGKSYLVFASQWNGRPHTSACSRNREPQKADAELKILGKGKAPKNVKRTE